MNTDRCSLPEHLKIYGLSNNPPNPVEELCRIGDAYLKATGLTPEEAIKRIMAEVRGQDARTGSDTPHGYPVYHPIVSQFRMW